MDDAEVMRAAVAESKLDAERLLALAQTAEIKDELRANTERSVARGAFGSPTVFVGDEIFFGKDRLRDVEEAIRALH
jgi:2-hydroxychromene-2-carboxylate isomerase